MEEPDYYKSNGLSPIGAFKQGLISREEYIGFLKGNIIKYTIRAGKKEDAVKDLKKSKDYINFYMDLFTMTSDKQKKLDEEIINTSPQFTFNVDNDIDWDKFKEDITEVLKNVNDNFTYPEIIETPTENPNILEIKLSNVMYDETGKLKPEARNAIKEYLINRRNGEN